MKLQEIKTELFTRVSKTSFGFRFEVFEDVKDKCYFKTMTIDMFEDGSINIFSPSYVIINANQLNEITRVANILKEENS